MGIITEKLQGGCNEEQPREGRNYLSRKGRERENFLNGMSCGNKSRNKKGELPFRWKLTL
jgi:hypothetical protein